MLVAKLSCGESPRLSPPDTLGRSLTLRVVTRLCQGVIVSRASLAARAALAGAALLLMRRWAAAAAARARRRWLTPLTWAGLQSSSSCRRQGRRRTSRWGSRWHHKDCTWCARRRRQHVQWHSRGGSSGAHQDSRGLGSGLAVSTTSTSRSSWLSAALRHEQRRQREVGWGVAAGRTRTCERCRAPWARSARTAGALRRRRRPAREPRCVRNPSHHLASSAPCSRRAVRNCSAPARPAHLAPRLLGKLIQEGRERLCNLVCYAPERHVNRKRALQAAAR